ncbi:hypothetical protein N0V93_006459 [Gnomoniopsis smithogilvyi]|uniref:Aldehyde dehydrogenase domain-containing protein n=1 Tax=Gnomoniopsis smithogilvyi TaxID=1191159 RepID=A0A9W8YPQ8_9PEZI|nr:hypothetical protein N0V93_006459 [Gnomoniopsis smithogilvyi]
MASDEAAIERLQMSAVDGRAENGRFRQDQLFSLHQTLREEAGKICAALQADSDSSAAEVEIEFYLAMEAIKHFYDTLNFEKDLKDEYSVAHGKDNLNRRVGLGVVVIRPTSYTRFYSIVTPLAAAIAAGNCVLLDLSTTLLQTDTILRALLTQALDVNTFAILKGSGEDLEIEGLNLVDQTDQTSSSNHLKSSTKSRCVAIVDRSADIDAAAKAITTARFSFGGDSPYAPDLVLVNEFVKQEFFEACSRYATLSFAGASGVRKVGKNEREEIRKAIDDAEAKRQVSTFGSNEFKLVDVLDRTASIANIKITGRYLPIATCSSLTDAVYNQDHGTSLLAGYFFAEPGSAKYLAQFLPCHISLINQIPTHLLVGPAAPTAHAADFLYRYNRDMFSVPRPQYVEKTPLVFQKVEDLLSGGSGKTTSKVTTSILREVATKQLPPTRQSENTGVGFFESGLLTGASIYLSMILPALGFTAYFLGKRGVEYASKLRQ